MKMRPDQFKRTAVQRKQDGVLQRPPQPGGRKAERRRPRHHQHFVRHDMLCQQRAYAMEKRIARGQHAYGTAALIENLTHRAVEWARPRPRRAANKVAGKLEMAFTSEHNLRVGD